MRVLVSTMEPDSVAHRALLAEGVEHTEHVCRGAGYSAFLADAWRQGGFVLVERDIVPWVGAIQQLRECAGDWCAFRYAFRGSTVRSLGLVKFSDRLTGAHRDIAREWENQPREWLEGTLLSAVHRYVPVCKHGPPVGRARGLD